MTARRRWRKKLKSRFLYFSQYFAKNLISGQKPQQRPPGKNLKKTHRQKRYILTDNRGLCIRK